MRTLKQQYCLYYLKYIVLDSYIKTLSSGEAMNDMTITSERHKKFSLLKPVKKVITIKLYPTGVNNT